MKKVLVASKNFSVCEDDFRYNDLGEIRTIQYVEQPKVAIAVALMPDDRIAMVQHWRPLLGLTLIECPGGKIDKPGESVEDGIRRELAEEIGLSAGYLELMGSFFSSVGTSTEQIFTYFAKDFTEVERNVSDTHRMRLVLLTKDELKRQLSMRLIEDGKSIIALTHFFSRTEST